MLRDLFFRIVARDETARAFGAVRNRLREVEGAAATVSERVGRVGQRLSGVGLAASAAMAPIGLTLRGMISASADFEGAMNRVGAATGASSDELAALRKLAADLGATTQFTATETALAIEMLAKNGLDASAILGGALSASLTMAAAGGTDLSTSADLATDVMMNFGKAAGDLALVADRVSGTLFTSKFDIDDYRLALAQAGGVAGGLGVSLDDFNATIAATSSLFASGSDAGTAFKTFLQRLVPASNAAAGAMDQLGLEFFDADGNMRSMAEIAQELQDGLAGLSDEAKNDALARIFGTDALRTAIGLANAGAEGIRNVHAAIGEVSATEQAEARMKGYNGAVRELASAWEGLGVAVGESGFLDMLTAIVRGGTGFVRWITESNSGLLRFTAIFLGLGVVLAPILATFGLLAAGIGAISAPVLAAVAGIAALTAAVAAFWPEIKAAGEWIAGTVGKMSLLEQIVLPVSLAVRGLVDLFAWAFPEAAAAVRNFVNDIGAWLGERLTGIVDSVLGKVRAVKDAFFNLWDAVTRNSYVPDMVDDIAAEFARLDGVMVDPATRQTATVASAFSDLGTGVGASIREMITSGEGSFRGFADRMIGAANRMADQIIDDAFARIMEAAGGLGGSGGGGIGGFFGSLLGGLFGGGAKIPALDTGGDVEIGGRGGIDRNLAVMRVTRGETVTVSRKGESRAGSVVVNIQTPNPAAFEASRGQIAATISRAVARGGRNL